MSAAIMATRMTVPCTVTDLAVSGDRDAAGNRVRTGTPQETVCYYREVSGEEATVSQDSTLTEYRVHLPPDTTVSSASTIDVEGLHLTVVGDPHVAREPSSGEVWFIRVAATRSKAG